ncbi:hypothetical protein ACHAXM_006889 [Skeletonema potamos]
MDEDSHSVDVEYPSLGQLYTPVHLKMMVPMLMILACSSHGIK